MDVTAAARGRQALSLRKEQLCLYGKRMGTMPSMPAPDDPIITKYPQTDPFPNGIHMGMHHIVGMGKLEKHRHGTSDGGAFYLQTAKSFCVGHRMILLKMAAISSGVLGTSCMIQYRSKQ